MSGFFKDIGEELYFSNSTNIDRFSQIMIPDLASFKVIKEILKKSNISTNGIESIEHNAFNLLIRQIELEKGNSKVEVGVIGSFSSGKSTFINSLFGKPICPMAVRPTTSSITKFYYGYKEKITIDGKEITKEEYHNLSQHQKGNGKDTKTSYIQYAYPFERLNSIIIYDTPGFNNNLNSNDTKVTMKTLNSVDVILFIVDISKGEIDMSSIERLKGLKDKRVYCILNKSDLKSNKAISKIREKIVSKKIFLEVIEYSASKVLEFGEKDYIRDHFRDIEERAISKRESFISTIKGVKITKNGRVKGKVEYRLHLDNSSFIIDNFYTKAKEQRLRVEKMLTRLLDSKQFTLKQKLKKDIYNYHKKAISIMKKTLQEITTQEESIDILKLKEELNNFIKEKQDNVTRL